MSALLDPFSDAAARRVIVLGHPGHELAMFGALQRHRVDGIVVITDGGPPERTRQSQRGFASIGLLPKVEYLGFPEDEFYRSLLDADTGFLHGVVASLRKVLDRWRPTQVFCDAVEFYNPVHDITLPIVRAALGTSPAVVYELPLVYEIRGVPETYRVQRVPDSLAGSRIVFDLSPDELALKIAARDEIYRSLHQQAGPELLRLPSAELAREETFVSAHRVTSPDMHDRALRYERRARLLHAEGRIERMITYADHFVPMLDALGVHRERR